MKKAYCFSLFLLLMHFGFAQFDVQGHRGARGLYPENSLEGFIYAVEIGANTIEMDVVMSKDGKIVVSHDHYLNSTICLDTAGEVIPGKNERIYNLFAMNYAQIKKCDCGSLYNPSFPLQKSMKTYKPLLSEVIDSVESFISKNNISAINYNIEVKSKSATDGMYHPHPDVFVAEIVRVIAEKGIAERAIIQSFDARVLKEIEKNYASIKMAYLLPFGSSPIKKIEKLGFKPDVISPYFSLVNKKLLKYTEANQMKLIPWTVNTKKGMKKLINKGVDGIITDYPARLIDVLQEIK